MAISDEKLKIVINNYFKSECDVNTSIREAFEKGFRIGVKKGLMQIEADRKTEPQTNGYQTFNGTSVYVSRLEDEPQTERSE